MNKGTQNEVQRFQLVKSSESSGIYLLKHYS